MHPQLPPGSAQLHDANDNRSPHFAPPTSAQASHKYTTPTRIGRVALLRTLTLRTCSPQVYDDNAREALNSAGSALGLPEPLQRKLALDAYYGWLLDITESFGSARAQAPAGSSKPTKPRELLALEQSAKLRECLQLAPSAVGELYSNTDIDGSVLRAYYEYLAPASAYEVTDTLQYLERVLDARPGVVAQILASS